MLRGDGTGELALTAKEAPESIVLDPRASARLRALLQAQTRCPVAPESDAETRTAQRWPRACFGDALRFGDLTFYLTK